MGNKKRKCAAHVKRKEDQCERYLTLYDRLFYWAFSLLSNCSACLWIQEDKRVVYCPEGCAKDIKCSRHEHWTQGMPWKMSEDKGWMKVHVTFIAQGLETGTNSEKGTDFFSPIWTLELLLLIGERWRAIFLNRCPILPCKIKNRLKNIVDMIHFTDTLFSLKSVVISA